MSRRKYNNATHWRCLRFYPQERYFKMFLGQCYAMGWSRTRYLDKIFQEHFRNLTESEQNFLLKNYDECFLLDLIRNWETSTLTKEAVHFLYSKIKYQKVMRLNIGFNEKEYKWKIMREVFDAVFMSGDPTVLKPLIITLNPELQQNVLHFAEEVSSLKKSKA